MIAVHDALATTFAVLASFYLRFEGSQPFLDRLPLLLRILPYFVAFSVVVCYAFNLTTTKWRFISLPDGLNILRAATVLTVALLVLDYIFVAPNVYGGFFLGKVTIVLYWFLEVFSLSAMRFAYRYFRYTRALRHARTEDSSPTLLVGRAADVEITVGQGELDQVLARIPIKPERAWSVGDPRLSPRTGVDMGGVQVRTYAVMPFVADPASIDASIAKVLRSDCLADEDFLRLELLDDGEIEVLAR